MLLGDGCRRSALFAVLAGHASAFASVFAVASWATTSIADGVAAITYGIAATTCGVAAIACF